MAVFDNLEKVVMKHGVSDAFVAAANTQAEITIQMNGVGNNLFPGKGRKPTTVIATMYNTEGFCGCCTVSDISIGTITVRYYSMASKESYYRIHWIAIWD